MSHDQPDRDPSPVGLAFIPLYALIGAMAGGVVYGIITAIIESFSFGPALVITGTVVGAVVGQHMVARENQRDNSLRPR